MNRTGKDLHHAEHKVAFFGPFDTLNSAKYKKVIEAKEPKRFISNSLESLWERLEPYGDDIKSAIKDLSTSDGKSVTPEDVIFLYYSANDMKDERTLFININNARNADEKYTKDFFDSRFASWGHALRDETDKDTVQARKILDIQDQLSLDSKNSSLTFHDEENKPTSFIISSTPKIITPQESLQLFNNIRLQPLTQPISVVFVQYNFDESEEKRYFKAADPSTAGINIFKDLHVGIQTKANTFYIRFAIAQSTYTVMYTPGEDVVIPLRMVGQQDFIERELRSFFPSSFGTIRAARYRKRFKVPNFVFNQQAMADIVLMNPQFHNFLYLDEHDKPLARKEHFILHYRGEYLVLAGTGKDEESKAEITLSNSVRGSGDSKIHELIVSIDKADDVRLLDRIAILVKILLNYYNSHAQPLIRFYQTADIENDSKDEKKGEQRVRVVSGKRESKLYKLRSVVPDLFPLKTYSQACVAAKQPTMIAEDKVNTYAEGRVIAIPPLEHKDVEGKRYFFTCESSKYPYPSVIGNSDPKTRDKFPVVPCCAQSSQTVPKGSYYEYVHGNVRVRGPARGGGVISTGKILGPGIRGVLPETIARALQTVLPQSPERLGVPASPNSLLHCVCLAVGDSKYKEEIRKEDYISFLRQRIAKEVQSEVYAQELYDTDRRSEMINDVTTFLDPQLYYRGLEEFFTINIYTFTSDGVEVPRYRSLHAHPPRIGRNTILIFKNAGTGLDPDQKYPQCELITYPGIETYTRNIATLCHSILAEQSNFLTWKPRMRGYNSLLYDQDYHELFQFSAYAQFIDGYGKLRGLFFRLPNKRTLVIIVPPGQPINIPTEKFDNIRDSLVTIEELSESGLSFVQNPTGKSLNNEGQLVGLHYQFLGLPHGLFIPIQTINVEDSKQSLGDMKSLPVVAGPIGGILSGIDPYRQRRLQHILNIIMQLIKYLYLLYRKGGGKDVASFMPYFRVNEYKGDSSTFYDLHRVKYKLPVGDFKSVMGALEEDIPTLIHRQSIIVYNTTFRNKIQSALQFYEKIIWGKLESIVPPQYIDDYYNEDTFTRMPGVEIFVGQRVFLLWLNQILNYDPSVRTSVINDINSDKPFVFYDRNEARYYLIQGTTKDSPYEQAINIAITWQREGYNIGAGHVPTSGVAVVHEFIYQIDAEGGIVLARKADAPEGNVIRLLQINKERYSALLPLT